MIKPFTNRFVSNRQLTHQYLWTVLSAVCFKIADWAFSSIPKSGVSAQAQGHDSQLMVHQQQISLLFKQPHGCDTATEEAEGIIF